MDYKGKPAAYAVIAGNKNYPKLNGKVWFFDTHGGTLVTVSVCGITDKDGEYSQSFHGLHIHAGKSCTGNAQEPFADADGHYNPRDTGHPQHAGDLPPLLSCQALHGCRYIRTDFIRRISLGKRLSFMRCRMIFMHSHPEIRAR